MLYLNTMIKKKKSYTITHHLIKKLIWQVHIFILFRPHLVQRIPHTNLLLVAIKSMFETCERKVMSSPVEIRYNGTDPDCQKLFLNELPRRSLSGCFSENPLVS
jgi:hypothetical protein